MKLLLSLLLLVISIATPALAKHGHGRWHRHSRGYTMRQRCVIANRTVFVLRARAGGLSPERRLDRVNERLAYILGNESCRPHSIRGIAVGGTVEIWVGNSILVTVTPADARACGGTVRGVADLWVSNLRVALPEARPRHRW